MSGEEQEGFLARWSRRKRAGAAVEDAQAAPPAPPAPRAAEHVAPAPADESTDTDDAVRVATQPAPGGVQASPPPQDVTEADRAPADLPPVETLTADSDLAAFLRPQVPAALRNAALRRVWSLDPAIRDYVGPADYAWDYNAPDGGVAGFAQTLGEGVRRLIAQAGSATTGPRPLAAAAAAAPGDAAEAEEARVAGAEPVRAAPGEAELAADDGSGAGAAGGDAAAALVTEEPLPEAPAAPVGPDLGVDDASAQPVPAPAAAAPVSAAPAPPMPVRRHGGARPT